MVTTNFYSPTIFEQQSIPNEITGIPSIDWNDLYYIRSKDSYAITKKPLHTISGMWMEKFLSNTSQLWLTGFNFTVNSDIVGIEFQLHILRGARIEDLIIQLCLNGELIGDNRASTVNPVQSDMYTGELTQPLNPVGDFNIYGSNTDMWGTELTSEQLADPTFGIVISFKSNVIYPHTDLAYVNQVALRVTCA